MTILRCANILDYTIEVDTRDEHGRFCSPVSRHIEKCGRAFESRELPDGRIQLICPRCFLAELEKPEPEQETVPPTPRIPPAKARPTGQAKAKVLRDEALEILTESSARRRR